MEIYRVGGSLRDQWLGRPCRDDDYTVLHTNETAFLAAFPKAKRVGGRQPVYYVDGQECTLSPAASLEEDLAQRDLTINALAQDLHGHWHYLPQTPHDLQRRRLRPVCCANFRADALRTFRAARFAAELPRFTATAELFTAMQEPQVQARLGQLAAERVGQEVRKACAAPAPQRFFELLHYTGNLSPWLPECQGLDSVPAGPAPYHQGSVWQHTLAVIQAVAGDELAVWMALCHDLGKGLTDPACYPHHYGHEQRGVALAGQLAQRLRLPRSWQLAGQLACRYHMQGQRYEQLRPGTRVDMLMALSHYQLLRPFMSLVSADSSGADTRRMQADQTRIQQVRLPDKYRNLGKKSGQILRQLRCQALA